TFECAATWQPKNRKSPSWPFSKSGNRYPAWRWRAGSDSDDSVRTEARNCRPHTRDRRVLAVEGKAGVTVAHNHCAEGLVDARSCQGLACAVAVGERGEPIRDGFRRSWQGLQLTLLAPRGEFCPCPGVGFLGSLGVCSSSVPACGFDELGRQSDVGIS